VPQLAAHIHSIFADGRSFCSITDSPHFHVYLCFRLIPPANVPSILRLGLRVSFAVRGGPRLFFSQHFAHSVGYGESCRSEGESGHRHLFLCLVLLLPAEIADHGSTAAIHILPVADEGRVLPLYHVVVRPAHY